jgi:hypothetical protein
MFTGQPKLGRKVNKSTGMIMVTVSWKIRKFKINHERKQWKKTANILFFYSRYWAVEV